MNNRKLLLKIIHLLIGAILVNSTSAEESRLFSAMSLEQAKKIKAQLVAGSALRTLSEVHGQWAFTERTISAATIVKAPDQSSNTEIEDNGEYAIKVNRDRWLDLSTSYIKNKKGEWISLASQYEAQSIGTPELNSSVPEAGSIAVFTYPSCDMEGEASSDKQEPKLKVGLPEPADGHTHDSCLQLVAGKTAFDIKDQEAIEKLPIETNCPNLQLVKKSPNGNVTNTPLTIVGKSGMREIETCCGFNSAKIGIRLDGENVRHVLLTTDFSRDCYGGTANDSFNETFKLEGNALILERSVSVSY